MDILWSGVRYLERGANLLINNEYLQDFLALDFLFVQVYARHKSVNQSVGRNSAGILCNSDIRMGFMESKWMLASISFICLQSDYSHSMVMSWIYDGNFDCCEILMNVHADTLLISFDYWFLIR